jgi:hypothetical protein
MGETQYRAFRGLVSECAKHDIGRTTAYELINDGLLETFTIGRKRYVYLDSLASLPQRLAERQRADA